MRLHWCLRLYFRDEEKQFNVLLENVKEVINNSYDIVNDFYYHLLICLI